MERLTPMPSPTAAHLRLGVNIDHVATIRNARGGRHPDPLRAAHLAVEAGADGITAHLREDRRHISDADIARLKQELTLPLNLEMASTEEMLAIALRHVPHACCLVPESARSAPPKAASMSRPARTTSAGMSTHSRAPASASRSSSSRIWARSPRRRGSAPTSSSCIRAPIATARSRTTRAAASGN